MIGVSLVFVSASKISIPMLQKPTELHASWHGAVREERGLTLDVHQLGASHHREGDRSDGGPVVQLAECHYWWTR